MKKKIIIALLIPISLILVFFAADFTAFYVCKKISKDAVKFSIIRHNFNYKKFLNNTKFSEPIGTQYKKKGIIIFGEGLAKGSMLEESQSLGAKLSKLSHRPVYNRAASGKFIQHALLQIENHTLDDYIKNSEYALIIVPSYQDTYRLKTYPGEAIAAYDLVEPYSYPVYEGKSPETLKLRHEKFPFFTSSCIYRLMDKIIIQLEPNRSDRNMQNLMNHLLRLRNDLTEINPNIKLIILTFYEEEDMLEDIKGEKSILFHSVEGNVPNFREDPKYFAQFDIPSELLWTIVAKQLIAKFKL